MQTNGISKTSSSPKKCKKKKILCSLVANYWNAYVLTWEKLGLANFFFVYEGPDSNYLGLIGFIASFAVTQLCQCSVKAVIDNM